LILGVVGTHGQPMTRLVGTLDEFARDYPDEQVRIQAGPAAHLVSHAQGVDYVGSGTLQDWAEAAAVVVTHGGPSLLLGLVDAGRTPIVMPRERRFGEHVDDHQVEFADFLATRGLVIVVRSPTELRQILEQPPMPVRETARDPLPPAQPDAASDTIKRLIDDLG